MTEAKTSLKGASPPAGLPSGFGLPDPAKLAHNLALAYEKMAKIAELLAINPEGQRAEAESQMLPMEQVRRTLGDIVQAHMTHPEKLAEAQVRLWGHYSEVWNNAWARAL
jgi:hypothetical protein